MRRLINYILGFIALLLLGLIFLPTLMYNRWLTRVDQYVDLNSLENRKQTYVFNILIEDKIEKTELSKEVRRLGISVPDERIWERWGSFSLFGGPGGNLYTEALTNFNSLLRAFEFFDIPDKERVEFMQKTLKCLQSDSSPLNKAQQIKDIANTVWEQYE